MARAQPGHLQVVCRLPARKIVSPLHVRSFLIMFEVKIKPLFFHIALTSVIFTLLFFSPSLSLQICTCVFALRMVIL